MNTLTLEKLFQSIAEKKSLPASLLLQGSDPYLRRELLQMLRKQSYDIKTFEVTKAKQGLDVAAEEAGQGGNLFSSKTLLFLSSEHSWKEWKDETRARWKRMLARAHPEDCLIILQVPSDKRLKWDDADCEVQISFQVDDAKRMAWISRMNKIRQAGLDEARLRFLASMDEELLSIDQYVELWGLGSDLWAEASLGWQPAKAGKSSIGFELSSAPMASAQNPAYLWVSAVIGAKRSEALRLLRKLLRDGQEPLMLLALLGKSLKIISLLRLQMDTRQEADFLIRQLRPALSQNPSRITGLLKTFAGMDTKLKSSSLSPAAALEKLSGF